MNKPTEEKYRVQRGKQHISGIRRYGFQLFFILMQLGLMVVWFLVSRRYIAHFYMLCELLSFCVVLHIVREDSNPSYKIPWIIVNLTLPILGGLSYLMFGRTRFSKDETRRNGIVDQKYKEILDETGDAIDELRSEKPWLANLAEYTRRSAFAPVYKNTQVEYFASGEKAFPRMLEELEKAERFIFLEYFIIHPGVMWDSIESVLERKAAEGVDVRVMYDSIGSFGLVPPDFVQKLGEKGIKACEFNKLMNIFSSRFNNRDHRKIMIIDGNVGFTGGINIADEYINRVERFGYWKDTAIMLRGEGVSNLTLMFLSLWEIATKDEVDYRKYLPSASVEAQGFVQPYGDIPGDSEPVGEYVYRNILCRARDYVYITTPYLIIDSELTNALTAAAKSGVDVRIITPGIPDKKLAYMLTRSYYAVLLRAGVRIYEYMPGFMHAKMFVSDDECAVVGTINLDYRSLCHHFEDAVWMCGTPAIADIKADVMACFEASTEVSMEKCMNKSIVKKLCLSVLRILAPLF